MSQLSYAAVLGGLDALVFTTGIGENSSPLRAAVGTRLGALPIALDGGANAAGGPRISGADSRFSVWVIPTNEEEMIAEHAWALLLRARGSQRETH